MRQKSINDLEKQAAYKMLSMVISGKQSINIYMLIKLFYQFLSSLMIWKLQMPLEVMQEAKNLGIPMFP